MNTKITLIVYTSVLVLVTNLSSAQPTRAPKPPETPEAPLTPEPPEPPEFPSARVAEQRAAEEAYLMASALAGHGAGSASQSLVIPKEAGDPKGFAEIEEDLNVMARILEKAASDDKHPRAMGIPIQGSVFGSAAPAPKNLYLEGHGVLFFLNVNFPLLAPPRKSSDADAKDKTSTEWEEARRELYRRSAPGFDFNWKTPMFGGPAAEYDADKVDELTRNIIAGLKNATHIRKLKSDETVTVVISGRSASGEARTVRRTGGGGASAGSGRSAPVIVKGGGSEGQGTRLILRTRKSEIDTFQKDKLSLEDFRKKVTVIVY